MENLRPKLTPQEKLEILYEYNLRLFRGLVAENPLLVNDPNEWREGYDYGTTET